MTDYDELARRVERGEPAILPGTIKRGASAASAARELLLTATGAATINEAVSLAVGLPHRDAAATEGRARKIRTTTTTPSKTIPLPPNRKVHHARHLG